tara:strand:+ start:314 stop:535 length:222 start_codon:yes stop_codon:yes gene_type:complete
MAQFTPEVAAYFLSDQDRFNMATAFAMITANKNAYISIQLAIESLPSDATDLQELSDMALAWIKTEINLKTEL